MKIVVIVITTTVLAATMKLPPNFQKCSLKQPAFNQCVFKAAQDAISQLNRPYAELDLPNLSPLHLAELAINGEGGPVSLHQKFKNCDLYGLDTLKLDQFEFDFESNELRIMGVVPEIRKKCEYEVKGRVLLLPVDERGNSTIIMRRSRVVDTLRFELRRAGNGTYLRFTDSVVALEPDFVSYDFRNYDERGLSEALSPVLNRDWREKFGDVKSYYEKLIDKIVVSVGNSVFSRVSMEEAFDY